MIELILTVASTISLILSSLYAIREIKRAKASIPSLDDFIEQDGETWMVDERLGKLIDALGSRMALSMRQSFFQQQGVAAKLEKNVKKAFSQDLMDQSGIGGILDLAGFSNVKKQLVNNPQTLEQIMRIAGPYLARLQGGQNAGANNGSSFQDPFR